MDVRDAALSSVETELPLIGQGGQFLESRTGAKCEIWTKYHNLFIRITKEQHGTH